MKSPERRLFEPEHRLFRESFRDFVGREITPFHRAWEAAGIVDRSAWRAAGTAGFLGIAIPERFGGAGIDDFRFNAIIGEELVRAGASGVMFTLHNDVVLPYLLAYATEEQQARWLPAVAAGEAILAIAMTEPGTGSDLAGIRTTAVRDGDSYLLSGAKTFISNGQLADLVIVVARTDPAEPHRGLSLLVVERDMPGFVRGRNLEKIGMHAQDTSELSFDDVRVPVANRLGSEGDGFLALMGNLPQERLTIAVAAVASAENVLERTLEYVKSRTAFGRPIGSFQANRFLLAELHTEVRIARVFLDDCLRAHLARELDVETAAMAKWWCTELQLKVIDRCLQLHGGYGYMLEYPIARAFVDSRVQTIYGGTTEIMKEIVGRGLGL
ncbi:MAG TPA: acyl-CoA dehydrogenase family protein [Mycobacteriales bacterium]|nr:acyl-CoA dehydrogenase family protein [Mycobacteriales bacterium]